MAVRNLPIYMEKDEGGDVENVGKCYRETFSNRNKDRCLQDCSPSSLQSSHQTKLEPGGKRSLEGGDGDESSLEPAHKRCKVENFPVSDLPNELLAVVLGRLPTGDKGKAAQVCHLWRELLDDPMLWKKTHVAIDMDTTTADCLLSLKKRQVTHLTISACSDVMILQRFLLDMSRLKYLNLMKLKGLSHNTHHDLFPHEMPAMKVLVLPCSGTQSIKVIATKMQNLETFCAAERCKCSPPEKGQVSFEALSSSPMQSLQKFYIINIPLEDDDIVHLKAGLPNVKIMWLKLSPKVSETGMQKVAEMASLEELYLKGDSFSQDISIRPLCTGMAKIRCLQLQYELSEASARSLATMNYLECLILFGDNGAILEHLTEGLPKLRTLNLFTVNDMSASSMIALAKMVQLECLNLVHCSISDEGLQILSKGLVKLKRLDLRRCHNFTDKGLEYLANMPSLRSLGLFDCKIGDDGLLGLSEGAAPLACLKVGQCSGVTPQGRKTLKAKRGISIVEHPGRKIIR